MTRQNMIYPNLEFNKWIPCMNKEISSEDSMLDGNYDHYFNVGYSALDSIEKVLHSAKIGETKKILDMPCGYGRVMRTIRAAFPESQITGCDLDKKGVDFCSKTFNAIPVYSKELPKDIQINEKFDLIWCGSLLTHLDGPNWDPFLTFFIEHLNNKGVLVFTTHGRLDAKWISDGLNNIEKEHLFFGLLEAQYSRLIKKFNNDGFGYENYPNQSNYGVSLSKPSWVLMQLEKHPDIRIISYTECGWDDHQDVIGIIKMD
jgi:cyclopropane fatty-acyl-phospholipid synthase-like methyltransferase